MERLDHERKEAGAAGEFMSCRRDPPRCLGGGVHGINESHR